LVDIAKSSRSDRPLSVRAWTQASTPTEQVRDSVWIVVPAFNEQSTIEHVVSGLCRFCGNIAVVDDYSSELTSIRARAAGAHVLRHPINLGQGASLQTGIDYALQNGATHIVSFDADLQHRPEDVPPLLRGLTETGEDFALGRRFLGEANNIDLSRKVLLKAAAVFTRLTTGLKLTDVHNGLRAMTSRGANALRIRQNRMAHASEILQQIAKADCPISRCQSPWSTRPTPRPRDKG
jgi:polyprenyl-phospho-N-acetylgalactosaminyl synthase